MRLPAIRPAATRTPGRIARPGVRAILLPVIAIALLAIPVAALGHAQLVAVTPADGSRLEVAPAALTLTFNEPVGLGPDGIVVLDARGARVDSVPETTDGPAIVQPLPPLADGWYLVTWAIVSEDGHPVRSASVFAVGDADAAARPVPPVDVANAIAALDRKSTRLNSSH